MGAHIPVAGEQPQLWNAARTFIGLVGHRVLGWMRFCCFFRLLKTISSLPSWQPPLWSGLWYLLLCCLLQQEGWRLLFVLQLCKSLRQWVFLCLWFNFRGNCCWGRDKRWSNMDGLCWGVRSLHPLQAILFLIVWWWMLAYKHRVLSPWVTVTQKGWMQPWSQQGGESCLALWYQMHCGRELSRSFHTSSADGSAGYSFFTHLRKVLPSHE